MLEFPLRVVDIINETGRDLVVFRPRTGNPSERARFLRLYNMGTLLSLDFCSDLSVAPVFNIQYPSPYLTIAALRPYMARTYIEAISGLGCCDPNYKRGTAHVFSYSFTVTNEDTSTTHCFKAAGGK